MTVLKPRQPASALGMLAMQQNCPQKQRAKLPPGGTPPEPSTTCRIDGKSPLGNKSVKSSLR